MQIIPERMFTSKSVFDGLFIGSRLWSQKLFDFAVADICLTKFIENSNGNIILFERRSNA